MRIPAVVLMGPPGAGKGTQAARLEQAFNSVYHVSSGELLRSQKDSPLARQYASTLARGDFFPDTVAMQLIKQALVEQGRTTDDLVLLDGTPRTVPQVALLNDVLDVRHVIVLDVSNSQILIDRMSARGERPYDNPVDAATRVDIHYELTAPVVDVYRQQNTPLAVIDAARSQEEVYQDIMSALKQQPQLNQWFF